MTECVICGDNAVTDKGIIYVRVKVCWNELEKWTNNAVCKVCWDKYGGRT